MTSPHVVENARRAIDGGSKSFAAASRLFNGSTRESAMLLYAWCRHCDDVVDGQHLGHGQPHHRQYAQQSDALSRFEALYEATSRAIAGRPDNSPVFTGLADVVQRHCIADHYPLEHLAGFRMDVENHSYDSLDTTLAYCWRVAGVVGVMMSMVMGRRDSATLDRACDLGMAFQLTNIARDVVEDAAVNRVYLPAEWLGDEGIYCTADILEDHRRTALGRVATRLVDAADVYYQSAGRGISNLPLRSAWSVATARGVYRHIGRKVKSHGARAWDQRVQSSPMTKLWFVASGAAYALASQTFTAIPRPASLWTRPM